MRRVEFLLLRRVDLELSFALPACAGRLGNLPHPARANRFPLLVCAELAQSRALSLHPAYLVVRGPTRADRNRECDELHCVCYLLFVSGPLQKPISTETYSSSERPGVDMQITLVPTLP